MSQLIEIIINDEYFNLVPRSSKEEFQALKESIMIEGQQEPIIINDKGVILDGHTRYTICEELGRDPEYRIKTFKTEYEERFYVVSCNLLRRQLNNFQKIELAYSLYKIIKSQQQYGGDRMGGKKIKTVGSTTAIVGRRIGLNRNLVQKGIWILENADSRTIKKLETGMVSISKTYDEIKEIERPTPRRNYQRRQVICPHCKKIFSRKEWRTIN